MLLARLLIGAVLGAAVVGVIAIYISGRITKERIKQELAQKNVQEAVITCIDNCTNVISMKDLNSDQEYEIHGDEISNDLYESQTIYV